MFAAIEKWSAQSVHVAYFILSPAHFQLLRFAIARVSVQTTCKMKLGLVVLYLFSLQEFSAGQPPPEVRTELALQGLLDYYWDHDPLAKNIAFFFSCGQVGGQGSPANWKQCSCYDSSSCLNCYRWWDAIAIESIATYGMYSNTSNHSQVPEIVFAHSPYNANYYGTTFMDDFAWYGIAYLRVYEWLNVSFLLKCDSQVFFMHYRKCTIPKIIIIDPGDKTMKSVHSTVTTKILHVLWWLESKGCCPYFSSDCADIHRSYSL